MKRTLPNIQVNTVTIIFTHGVTQTVNSVSGKSLFDGIHVSNECAARAKENFVVISA